jgi:hypothetical protein
LRGLVEVLHKDFLVQALQGEQGEVILAVHLIGLVIKQQQQELGSII